MKRFFKAADIGTSGASTLPGEYYTSPEVFAEEQERVFARQWLCAGREASIPGRGDYFLRNFGNESVIVLRGAGGETRAFYNVCRHRGARMCEQPQGKFNRSIRCPYHAWTYDLDGSLVGASGMESLNGFDKRDYPLHPVRTAIWEGFIFLALEEPESPFEEMYAPLVGRFSRYNLSQLSVVRRIDYDVRANWKLVFENYSECYHCATVHPALVKLTPADSGENDLISGPFLGGFMTVTRRGGSMTQSGYACSLPVGELSPEDMQRAYYYAIFPNMLLSLHQDHVMVHRLWPVAPNQTLIECEWLFHPAATSQPDFRPDDCVEFWDVTNRQDWHVCELSQQGVTSRAYSPGPYAPRDSLSAAFDREYLRAMGTDEHAR